jgi:hypothetical protein
VEIQSDVFVILAVSLTPSSLRDNGIASTEFGTTGISSNIVIEDKLAYHKRKI